MIVVYGRANNEGYIAPGKLEFLQIFGGRETCEKGRKSHRLCTQADNFTQQNNADNLIAESEALKRTHSKE